MSKKNEKLIISIQSLVYTFDCTIEYEGGSYEWFIN